MQRLSLAQQIAQLEDVAPLDFDPEDVQINGINPDPDLDNDAARAHYIDVSPSSLRKPHESLSDPKYDGSKTSRKLMLDDSDDNQSNPDPVLEGADSESSVSSMHSETRDIDRENGPEHETNTRASPDASIGHPSASELNNDLPSSLRKTREEDREKGKAISRQMALWDSLLDARIRLQKSVAAGNRLPPNVQIPLVKMLSEAQSLSDEIFDFQEHLLSVNESVQFPPRKRRRNNETEYSVADYAEQLREASHAVSELERAYHPHLVHTLGKWSSKIQAVAPSVLLPSNRNAFSKTSQQIKSAAQLIDETLADHGKVLARTRIYRGRGSRLGVDATDNTESRGKEDVEVFDDGDFYQQLLRDIIDARGNEPSGNEDWMAVQKQKKAKKVDTKASKGRKLRFEVHEKIQNFMVPVPTQGSWHEEQIDELFASLFGKGFEGAMQEAGETMDESMPELEEMNAALKGGFRIFG